MESSATVVNSRNIKELIRTIPNFPKPGIQFRDVTTLLNDAKGFRKAVDELTRLLCNYNAQKIIAIESRGFTIGGVLAQNLGCGMILARKTGKLPGPVTSQRYELEYGHDTIEIHNDAIEKGERCIVVDDLLATGGTCNATCELVEKLGGVIVACGFIINLPDLAGNKKLARYPLHWLVDFGGH